MAQQLVIVHTSYISSYGSQKSRVNIYLCSRVWPCCYPRDPGSGPVFHPRAQGPRLSCRCCLDHVVATLFRSSFTESTVEESATGSSRPRGDRSTTAAIRLQVQHPPTRSRELLSLNLTGTEWMTIFKPPERADRHFVLRKSTCAIASLACANGS